MYRLKLSNASSTNGWSNRLWRNCQFSRFAKFVKIGKWRKDSIGLSRRNAGPIKWTVHTNKSFNPSQGPIEVMTAINCSHRRVHETRWKRKRKRKRKRERERERGAKVSGPEQNWAWQAKWASRSRATYTWLLFSFSFFLVLFVCLSFFLLLLVARSMRVPLDRFSFSCFSTDVQLGCHKSAIPDGRSGSRNRACKTSVKGVLSERESMGKQWADSS